MTRTALFLLGFTVGFLFCLLFLYGLGHLMPQIERRRKEGKQALRIGKELKKGPLPKLQALDSLNEDD